MSHGPSAINLLAAVAAVVTAAGCGVGDRSPPARIVDASGNVPWERPVPKAQCGIGDRAETGFQGQVPLPDRMSGRSAQGYTCNLELVGQAQGEGAGWQHAWYDRCSYFGTADGDGQQHRGVVVVDAADSAQPAITAHLDSVSMLDPWESLKVSQQRGVLAAVNSAGGGGGPEIDVYDVSDDCAQPKLLVSEPVGNNVGHAGTISDDGLTYYGSEINVAIYPIDISDPAHPVQLARWLPPEGIGRAHDLSISADGTRGYIAQPDRSTPDDVEPNGLVIVDFSEVQARKFNPEIRAIGTLYWEDGATAQETDPFFVGGHPYVMVTDEMGAGGLQGWGNACAEGQPPFGFARVIDIADETAPKLVAKLMLEVHDPANCELVVEDAGTGGAIFGYDSHYCTVDNAREATMAACGYFQSGLRVFDIRDPYHPREIAYYNPPAQIDQQNQLPGSNHIGAKTADWASSNPRFRLDRGEIWFTSQDNGFQIVRFTNGVWPLADAAP